MMQDALVARGEAIIEQGSKSFTLAAKLFDRRTREHAVLLYAWCRYCDDVIDGQQLGHSQTPVTKEDAAVHLACLRQRTSAVIAGLPATDPVFAGLQCVVQRYDLPQQYLFELLDGFAMDVARRRFEHIDDTLEYCYHVAGVVGVMMAWIMGVRESAVLRRAADLGIALQLTNISRDVFDDARVGRIYLPLSWLQEAHIPERHLSETRYRIPMFALVRRLLDTAEPYYQSARWGLPQLAFRSAWAVAAARDIYHEIGAQIIRQGPERLDERALTPKGMRYIRLGQSFAAALRAVVFDRSREAVPRPAWLWSKF